MYLYNVWLSHMRILNPLNFNPPTFLAIVVIIIWSKGTSTPRRNKCASTIIIINMKTYDK